MSELCPKCGMAAEEAADDCQEVECPAVGCEHCDSLVPCEEPPCEKAEESLVEQVHTASRKSPFLFGV